MEGEITPRDEFAADSGWSLASNGTFPAEIFRYDVITWDYATPGQINDRQEYAGHHVGHVEKRREVQPGNKRKSGLQTGLGWPLSFRSMNLDSDSD